MLCGHVLAGSFIVLFGQVYTRIRKASGKGATAGSGAAKRRGDGAPVANGGATSTAAPQLRKRQSVKRVS